MGKVIETRDTHTLSEITFNKTPWQKKLKDGRFENRDHIRNQKALTNMTLTLITGDNFWENKTLKTVTTIEHENREGINKNPKLQLITSKFIFLSIFIS